MRYKLYIYMAIFTFWGCSNSKPKVLAKKHSQKVEITCQDTFQVDTLNNIEITITNHSHSLVFLGEDYEIERRNKNSWVNLPLTIAYNSIGYKIENGMSVKMKIPLLKEQYKYKSDLYRISKKIRYIDGHSDTIYTSFYLLTSP